jgi:fumarylpyruvate hydrolase
MPEQFVFTPPNRAILRVRNADAAFPVHRIYCVGRNYADHAIEMGGDPKRESPFFFQKNPDNIVIDDGEFPYPSSTSEVHHEVELIVALNGRGHEIDVHRAREFIYGYGVGLDMTRRDLQAECKKAGRPWEIAKAFEKSAPCSALIRASEIGHPETGAIWLKVNGETRQQGDLGQMIWKVPEIISYLSGFFELAPGDVIMTGTPAGVAATRQGDRLHGHIQGVGSISCLVV